MALEDPVIAPEPQAAAAADGLPPRFACFVAGTDTEIGKTLTSSAMLYSLVRNGARACGMKPVAAGAVMKNGQLHNDDADQLIEASNVHLPQALTTPFMLKEPAAPHIAAALEVSKSIRCRSWRRMSKSPPPPMPSWWKAWAASACR